MKKWMEERFGRMPGSHGVGGLPHIPWENPVSSGSMPMEVLELAWTQGLAGSQSSKALG